MASKVKVDTIENSSGDSEIKIDTIKHSNGTTAITVNSDGSLSGKFEGAVKFQCVGKPSSGDVPSGKVWVSYGTQGWHYGATNLMGGSYGQPVAIKENGQSWVYKDIAHDASGYNTYGLHSPGGSESPGHHAQFTHTLIYDKV